MGIFGYGRYFRLLCMETRALRGQPDARRYTCKEYLLNYLYLLPALYTLRECSSNLHYLAYPSSYTETEGTIPGS